MRTRIKICGITRLEDALAAVELGVDALGFVFVPRSPRYIEADQVLAIVRQLPPFVTTVGLFMDQTDDEVAQVLAQVPLGLLQFHGRETAAQCRAFAMPYIKAVPMGGGVEPANYMAGFDDSLGFLFDSHALGEVGGSGHAFDWSRLPSGGDKPLILAGGLTPENVAEAVRVARPYAVDVSSGVEASKGIKDAAKMAAFVAGVRQGE